MDIGRGQISGYGYSRSIISQYNFQVKLAEGQLGSEEIERKDSLMRNMFHYLAFLIYFFTP